MADDLVNLFDYEARARETMPEVLWNMVYAGFGDELSTKRIRPAFESIFLVPKALAGRSAPNTATTLLGANVDLPVLPSAPGRKLYVRREGELDTARAAERAGTIMLIPHVATYQDSLESYRRAAPGGKFWFQLYVLKDRGATRAAIAAAEAAGCTAIVLTVSSPSPRGMPVHLRDQTSTRGRLREYVAEHFPGTADPPEFEIDQSIEWPIVTWLRSQTKLPVIVKGIVRPEDAKRAVEYGAAGVLVSTHAARLVDGPIATIEALPPIVEAAGAACEVYLDGGVRTGTDVFKALALGARACLIGKPLFYGLAVAGEEGVVHSFAILKRELESAMVLCGAGSTAEIAAHMVVRPQLRRL